MTQNSVGTRVVTGRGLVLTVASVVAVMGLGAAIALVDPTLEGLLWGSPLVLVGSIAAGLGVATRRVVYADLQGVRAVWEPFGLTIVDVPRSAIAQVTVQEVGRSFFAEFWKGAGPAASYGTVVVLKHGPKRIIAGPLARPDAMHVLDYVRRGLQFNTTGPILRRW